MKLLLDENLPHSLRYYFPGHDARTVDHMRWKSYHNGDLLRLAISEEFDAMITMDSRIARDYNIAEMNIALVTLKARSNKFEDLRPLVPELLDSLTHLVPGQAIEIPATNRLETTNAIH